MGSCAFLHGIVFEYTQIGFIAVTIYMVKMARMNSDYYATNGLSLRPPPPAKEIALLLNRSKGNFCAPAPHVVIESLQSCFVPETLRLCGTWLQQTLHRSKFLTETREEPQQQNARVQTSKEVVRLFY